MTKKCEHSAGATAEGDLLQAVVPQASDVIVGVLLGLDTNNVPLVVFPQSLSPLGVAARSLAELNQEDVGAEVALLFERGDLARPLILGRIRRPESLSARADISPKCELDGESLVLSASKDIVLRCGQASITLTRSGKILIRGAYVLSHSSGANRIRGGSINLN